LYTNDLGKNWNITIPKSPISGSLLYLDQDENLYLGNQEDGLLMLDKLSLNWNFINHGLYCHSIDQIEVNDSGLLLVTTFQGLHRSLDDGTTWELIFPYTNSTMIFKFKLDPTTNNIYAIVNYQLLVSSDLGNSWDSVKVCDDCNAIYDITINADGELYCCTGMKLLSSSDGGHLWKVIKTSDQLSLTRIYINHSDIIITGKVDELISSLDHGQNWFNITTPPYWIHDVYVDPDDKLYVFTSYDGVFKSDNWGKSWQKLDDNNIIDIKVLPNGNYILSSFLKGIQFSLDKGVNWSFQNTGLFELSTGHIATNNKGRIYLATFSTSLYKSSQLYTGFKSSAQKNATYYIRYANHQIHLHSDLTQHQDFTLNILNLDGKPIQIFPTQKLEAGRNEIKLPLKDLTPGFYFYQIKSENQLFPGKFLVLE
jgi:photosystem II stability/assembly factor-like uncharacterized protein